MSVRRNLAFAFGGNFGFFVIQFAASLVVARLLSPSEMGVYAASMATVYILNGVLNVGLMGYVVREKEMPRDKLGTVLTLTVAQAMLLSVGLYLGAGAVGALARDARVTESLQILSLSAGLLPVLTTLQGIRQRRMDFGMSSAVMLVSVGVASATTIALAYNGWSYRAQPWANNIGTGVALMVALIVQRREINIRPSLSHARAILKYGASILGASLIQNVTNRLPDIILTGVRGAAATGLYNRGAGLIDIFNNAIVRSVQRVLASQMAADRRAGHGIGGVYGRMTRTMTGLLWPFFRNRRGAERTDHQFTLRCALASRRAGSLDYRDRCRAERRRRLTRGSTDLGRARAAIATQRGNSWLDRRGAVLDGRSLWLGVGGGDTDYRFARRDPALFARHSRRDGAELGPDGPCVSAQRCRGSGRRCSRRDSDADARLADGLAARRTASGGGGGRGGLARGAFPVSPRTRGRDRALHAYGARAPFHPELKGPGVWTMDRC